MNERKRRWMLHSDRFGWLFGFGFVVGIVFSAVLFAAVVLL